MKEEYAKRKREDGEVNVFLSWGTDTLAQGNVSPNSRRPKKQDAHSKKQLQAVNETCRAPGW